MDKVIKLKTKTEEEHDKCVRILEVMLVKARQNATVGVAVVTVDADGSHHINLWARDFIQLLGGLARTMSDVNRLMDEENEVDA